jgi:hypothetical protein
MGHTAAIYSDCSRVVVYRGVDAVTRVTSGKYPRHVSMDEFYGNDPSGFRGLLQRRYFSRIWIIQKLILPRQVVFCIGEINVTAGPGFKVVMVGENTLFLYRYVNAD